MRKFVLMLLLLQSGCVVDDIYGGDISHRQSYHERTCSNYGFVYGTSAFAKCMMDLDEPKHQQNVVMSRQQQNVIIHNNTNDNRDYLAQQDRLREMQLRTERENIRLQRDRAEIERERLKNENQRYSQEQIRVYQEKKSFEVKRLEQQEAAMRQQQEQAARDQQAQEAAMRQQQEQAKEEAKIEEEKREAYERGQRTWDPSSSRLQSSPYDNPY